MSDTDKYAVRDALAAVHRVVAYIKQQQADLDTANARIAELEAVIELLENIVPNDVDRAREAVRHE